MSPLAKVGGLGDVAGSLPRALVGGGLDVRVAMPLYGSIDRSALTLERVTTVDVAWPGGAEEVRIHRASIRGVTVYLFENERFFGGPSVYGGEEAERFLFLSDALLASAPSLGFSPDVVHAQDWHSAMLLSRLAGQAAHPWSACGLVYTIHNLGMQGEFTTEWAGAYGIAREQLIPPDGLPPEITMSAMAQGIMHADRINTVSTTYAKEILTPEYGAGLDPLLRARAHVVSGIVNGIDYDEFNPATDPFIEQHYDADTLDRRAANRSALQRDAGLPGDDLPIFATVTRLFPQKGMDLVASAFEELLARHSVQLIILGTGDESVHERLLALQSRYPANVKIWLDFNPPIGQKIYAGCDVFLMPSRYEPCGLGQLIALRYGAVPLVRRTGGLNDTVQDVDGALTAGTGFVFENATDEDLRHACERAVAAFAQRDAWRGIQRRGMSQDWSWGRAAHAYASLYDSAASDARQRRGA